MIMISNNPWSEIPIASQGQISRLRVNASAAHTLFWFRDDAGRLGLLVAIHHDTSSSALNKAKINIRDISTDVIEVAEEGIKALTIRLEENQNRDVFLKLCLDLVERVNTCDQDEDIFLAVCGRLKKWQSLLSGRGRSLLSANEIQGLYAELYFIAEMLEKHANQEELIIRGWEGPEKIQHDFVLDDIAVEIKSIAGNQRGKVRISSEDQLDTHLGQLYLRVYFLSEIHEDGKGAESLNSIVKRISSMIQNQENKVLFETKLEVARYIDIPDYDTPLFRIKDCRTYLATDEFPRITRKMLPEGLEAVSYDLVLASIEKYRTKTEIMEG
jgi:hypothetical protein